MHQGQSDRIKINSAQVEDDIFVFFDNIPDAAIERAADVRHAGAFTIGNCTGLGSCPA